MTTDALIIVDVQNDFCPGGALAVPEGGAIVAGINELAPSFETVATTQDWHPEGHGSFASSHDGKKAYEMGTLSGRDQVMWPDHCVRGTPGAEFHPDLRVEAANFLKGTNPEADSYSGFTDDDGAATGLDGFLKSEGVERVFLCGLATDYCVNFTARDALGLGFKVVVIEDLCRPVDITPGDGQKALDALRSKGAGVQSMREVLAARDAR